MPLNKPDNADKTPTRPHIPAEVVSGDYDVLKRALDATEAHVIHLHGEVVGLEAEVEALRTERDGFARTALEQRALLDEARELVDVWLDTDWLPSVGGGNPHEEEWQCQLCNAHGTAKTFKHADDCTVTQSRAWLARAGGENGA